MNDEIKEILSLLNSSSWSNEAEKIEDYITNLQQENSNLKFSNQALNNELGLKLYELDHLDEKRNELKKEELKEYVKLQQENERLKDIVVEKDNQIKEMILQKTDYTAVNILEMKLEDYKSRCEKAIEYIEDNTYYKSHKGYVDLNDLLNILQNGGDKE